MNQSFIIYFADIAENLRNSLFFISILGIGVVILMFLQTWGYDSKKPTLGLILLPIGLLFASAIIPSEDVIYAIYELN